MYLLLSLGIPQDWIVIIAPVSAVAAAGIFLGMGRSGVGLAPTSEVPAADSNTPIIVADTSMSSQVDNSPQISLLAVGADRIPVTEDSENLVISADNSPHDQERAVDKLMEELESKMEQQGMIVTAGTQAQVIAAEIPQEEPLSVVDGSKQQIAKKRQQRCIIIAAQSYGILQDRLNNWLTGGYGLVISSSMSMNEKGFYLAIFYEPSEIQ